ARDTVAVAALRQILAQPHRDLGLDAQAAIVAHGEFGAAVMDLAGEDRAVAGLVNPAQLLHDRRRQADLVAGDGAAPARDLDLLENGADRIGFVETRRHQLGRQDVGLPPLTEPRGDALRLFAKIQPSASRFTTEAPRTQRKTKRRSRLPGESRDPLIRGTSG